MRQTTHRVTGLAVVLATVALIIATVAAPAAHAIGIGCSNRCLESFGVFDTTLAVYE
ncbi:MAG: hypothetical protein QN155_03960 [Armatimonadota bacterium]|nr:hypothetical protein [Armatimonadota bacterium]MDR7404595.1 hypothetical protein [Armatimonadota bacterium]